ncbi:MAG: cytochrome c oxidase subunit 3 family protein, partial [Hyphomicrobiaceae bacterium]|nr:cytochrome c oxidase subunit 3 family protein [Hyphomicrobiaceae bacterium]
GIVAAKLSLETVEIGTSFWHMVDLVWVLLFPIVYLMR